MRKYIKSCLEYNSWLERVSTLILMTKRVDVSKWATWMDMYLRYYEVTLEFIN